MIYTGIVEDNADPRHYNRVRVRLYGVHTDQDGGKPQIPADDLPWATPMMYGPIPPLGSKVNVLKDDETYYYFCPFPTVKMSDSDYQNGVVMLHQDNLGQNVQGGKVTNSKQGQYITVMYTDSKGYMIEFKTESGTNQIVISPDNNITIKNAKGNGRTIDMGDDKITLKANTIDLDCKKLQIGSKGNKKLVTSDFLHLYNTHTHTCPGGTTAAPTVQVKGNTTKNIDITE